MRGLMYGAALAAALAVASPGAAAVVTVTGLGTVTGGTDQTGVFGGVGDLTGSAFSLSFSYDTAGAPPGDQGFFGGPGGSWLGVTVKVGGQSFTFAHDPAATFSSVELGENGASDLLSVLTQSEGTVGDASSSAQVVQSFGFSAVGDLFGSVLSLPLLTGALSATGSGAFTIDDILCSGAVCDGRALADVSFNIDTLSATAQSAVPEPGMIGLLGAGLAGLGLTRRRKAP